MLTGYTLITMIEEAIKHLDKEDYENIKNHELLKAHDFFIPEGMFGTGRGVILCSIVVPYYVAVSRYYIDNVVYGTWWHYCELPDGNLQETTDIGLKNLVRGSFRRHTTQELLNSKSEIFNQKLKRKIIFNLDIFK